MAAHGPWAARLPLANAAAAARLRTLPGVEAVVDRGHLWLRGANLDRALDVELRKVAGLERFAVRDGIWLVGPTRNAPSARLPQGGDEHVPVWLPLRDVVALQVPPAALGAAAPEPVRLTLVRAARPVHAERGVAAGALDATALLVDLRAFARWCELMADVRLAPLVFAAARDGRALVHGVPLPPLPGTRCSAVMGVCVPCGWTWSPPVDAATLRATLHLAPGDVAVLRTIDVADGRGPAHADRDAARVGHVVVERIDAASLVPASRSAARLTLARVAGERVSGTPPSDRAR